VKAGTGVALAVVQDLRSIRPVPDDTDLDAFEQDLIAGFVLARSASGVTDKSIQAELRAVGEFRESIGRHLWTARPDDADRLLGQRCRGQAKATIAGKAFAISVFFQYLELRHQVEIHAVTGETVQCPIDEMNRPRDDWSLNVRIPPTGAELEKFFDGWRDYLTAARKYLPAARGYAAARLWSQVGLRIGETRRLDMTDVLWESGPLGKLHVRFGKGSRRRGPKQRITPLINGARPLLEWFVTDVRGQFDDRWDQPGAPLLCSERNTTDGDACRVSAETLRVGLAHAVARHLPAWRGRLSPHVLRHHCASSLYRDGVDIVAIQELLGHEWIATTMGYVHVNGTHIEDSWARAAERSAARLTGGRA
jgi:site-specific recombinase XerD